MESIIFEIKDNVAYITLNRPKVFNSVNREMALKFIAALEDCTNNQDVRCVYLTGVGKAFCAGQDLGEILDPEGPELTDIVSQHYNPIIELIVNMEKPVVCAVNGVAAGAGANIALACDITIAAASASFIQAFSKIGLIPDSGGTFFLPRIIGLQKAKALMFLGDKVSAKEAEEMGMIYKVSPDDSFEKEAQSIALKLAKMPTYGIGLTKRALNDSFTNSLTKQLRIEDELQTNAGLSEDYKEGVNAFVEKRKPNFVGR